LSQDAYERDPATSVRFQVPSNLDCQEKTVRERQPTRKRARADVLINRITKTSKIEFSRYLLQSENLTIGLRKTNIKA
jgi:hypothetical protein